MKIQLLVHHSLISWCLFLSTNPQVIERLQGEREDILCLTKVAIRPAYESVSFNPDQYAIQMPPLPFHQHSNIVSQTVPGMKHLISLRNPDLTGCFHSEQFQTNAFPSLSVIPVDLIQFSPFTSCYRGFLLIMIVFIHWNLHEHDCPIQTKLFWRN